MRSIWEIVEEWLNVHEDRSVTFKHGGDGGRWYCELLDEEDRAYGDAGDEPIEALVGAWGVLQERRA